MVEVGTVAVGAGWGVGAVDCGALVEATGVGDVEIFGVVGAGNGKGAREGKWLVACSGPIIVPTAAG